MINLFRQQNTIKKDDSNSRTDSGTSLSDRFKALNSKSTNGQNGICHIAQNAQPMPNRPISRARRTGAPAQNKAPETNSLPETARLTQQTTVAKVQDNVANTAPCPPLPRVAPCPPLPVVPLCPPLPAFDDISSDDDVKSIDEIVENVAAKNSQINNNQNGK